MQLTGLSALLRASDAYQTVLTQLENERGLAANVIRAARPFLLAALARDWPGPVIYLTAHIKRAYNVTEQLPVWLDDDITVLRYAEPTPHFYERVPWGEGVIRNRLETLAALADDAIAPRTVVVTSARALMQRTLPVNQFRRGTMQIEAGQRWSIDKTAGAMGRSGLRSRPDCDRTG